MLTGGTELLLESYFKRNKQNTVRNVLYTNLLKSTASFGHCALKYGLFLSGLNRVSRCVTSDLYQCIQTWESPLYYLHRDRIKQLLDSERQKLSFSDEFRRSVGRLGLI